MDQQSSIDAALAKARTYIGTKWRHRGRNKFGIDCIGLLVVAMTAGGFVMRDRTDYSRTPHMDGLEREMLEHFGEPVEDLRPGDVVLMAWDGQTEPSHVGLIGNGQHGVTLIHSYSQISVTEHGIDAAWRKRIIRIYRPWP
ncbi:C40 family peptidase [Pseudomonas sp. Leaf127]|uniref:C40 family peptidase n=1 Tax=Pseudomonas sp. Leaf127 TaxID=1736267 RepID=UPI0009ECB6CF|nr:NlpC/P60 family protein [Pseudomonas sp. Leaf127]